MTTQTTPAKALAANPGLRDLAPSVTGGALVAQGYWMPYQCARALCLTFAYAIRHALTPIFGPSFVRECLRPTDPGFNRFKIEREVIRVSQMQVDSWLSAAKPIKQEKEEKDIPRSVPAEFEEKPRVAKPTFMLGSPFASSESGMSSNRSTPYGLGVQSAFASPEISPKSATFSNVGWTTVNHPTSGRSSPPSPPQNTPVGSLSGSLLTEPRYPAWRAADPVQVIQSTATPSPKRARRDSIDETYSDSNTSASCSSDSDGMETDDAPKRVLRSGSAQARVDHSRSKVSKPVKSKKYTAEDFRAAELLLKLSDGCGAGSF